MKRIFTIAVLLASLASVAFADGPGFPPRKPPKAGAMLLADGPGLPPTGTVKKPIHVKTTA